MRAALTGRRADGSAAEVHEQEEDGRSGVHASPRRPAHISHAALSYTNGAALAADGSLYVWGGGAWGGGGWEGAGISGAPQGDDGVRPSRLETVAVDPAYACVGTGRRCTWGTATASSCFGSGARCSEGGTDREGGARALR